jgi:hypothetical protein
VLGQVVLLEGYGAARTDGTAMKRLYAGPGRLCLDLLDCSPDSSKESMTRINRASKSAVMLKQVTLDARRGRHRFDRDAQARDQ